jgi:hypothetical protein
MNLVSLRMVGFVIAVLWLGRAHARASDQQSTGEPLWQRAIREVKKSQGLIAAKVVTHIAVRDGDDVFLGSIESVDVLATPDKIPPTWVNVSKKSMGSPGFTMELNLHIEDDPGSILDGYATWTNQGAAEWAGRSVVRWEGVALSADAFGARASALAYIEPDTARPRQVDLVLPIRSNLGTRLVSVTVIFGAGPRGSWVPVSAVIDQSGRFMFWKRHLIITKSFQEWTERGSPGLTMGGSAPMRAPPPP